jgi:endoglucanase
MGSKFLKSIVLLCLAGFALAMIVRQVYAPAQEVSSGVGPPARLTSNTKEAVEGAGKIPIDPQRWYQLTDAPDGIPALFDGITNANISRGWGKLLEQYQAYYPLLKGESFVIESVKMYDGEGSSSGAPMVLSVITEAWEQVPIATFMGSQYQQWVGPEPNEPSSYALAEPIRNARYLVITSASMYPTEIELYGSYKAAKVAPVPAASTLAAQKAVKLKHMFGVNAFEWNLEDGNNPSEVDPVRLKGVKNFTGIRHYLDWEKLEPTPGNYTFNPSHNGSWNYDAMYSRLKQEGVEVLVCLKTLPKWMQESYPASERDAENVPARFGQDVTAPASYVEQAKVAFQFAARYGNNATVPRKLMQVSTSPPRWTADPVNEVKTGLGLIRYMECDNERDKWWKGRKAYQTAAEYAANLSAFYDGHKNTLGPGVGVKNADPKMQVVMGGLAAPTPDYVKGMIDWCRQHRGYKADGSVNLCWDVINYHLYSNDARASQGGEPTRGTAPEVSEAGQVAKAFVQMAHEYAGGMPVWITETGYDYNQGSPLKAIAIGKKSVQETQADWILRTSLLYARWGVERVFLYQLYDDNPQSPTRFGSMGLLNGDKTPRPAAQYVSQANKLMGGYSYKQTLHADPIVDRYELHGRSAYVLVVPDEKGRTAPYTLNLGSATYADVYRPAIGKESMDKQRVTLQQGKLPLQVTETPVFVLVPSAQ